jgi:hypothetical protein
VDTRFPAMQIAKNHHIFSMTFFCISFFEQGLSMLSKLVSSNPPALASQVHLGLQVCTCSVCHSTWLLAWLWLSCWTFIWMKTCSKLPFICLTGSLYTAQADLELSILLSQPPKCWDYKHAPLRPDRIKLAWNLILFYMQSLFTFCSFNIYWSHVATV